MLTICYTHKYNKWYQYDAFAYFKIKNLDTDFVHFIERKIPLYASFAQSKSTYCIKSATLWW